MASATRHLLRLLGWGRVLARHGCLVGIERAATTPPAVRRLCRLARLGTFPPQEPDYARAFQAIGLLQADQQMVPAAGAPRDAYGNIPRGFIVQML